MDWRLPLMDGIGRLDGSSRTSGFPTPAVILVTAYGREECCRVLKRLVLMVLIKPVSPPTVRNRTLRALGTNISHRGERS